MRILSKITEAKGVSGVYAIKNKANSKIYVGSASNIYKRLNMHRSTLRSGNHHNIYLQRSWVKHGEENFLFCVLEETTDLLECEQRWLDDLFPTKCYNLTPTAKSPKGYKHTQEAIEKIREWQKDKTNSEQTKDRMRDSRILVKGRGKSKYKGLSYVDKKKLWEVRIMPQRGEAAIYLGAFQNEKEAARNYDYHAIQFYGRGNCFLNFPKHDYSEFEPRKKL